MILPVGVLGVNATNRFFRRFDIIIDTGIWTSAAAVIEPLKMNAHNGVTAKQHNCITTQLFGLHQNMALDFCFRQCIAKAAPLQVKH